MPSPFPGMDPFLEDPAEFAGFHDAFVIHLQESLQARLPRPYFAKPGRRVWVEVTDRRIGPGVGIVRGRRGKAKEPPSNGSSVGVLTITPPLVIQATHDESSQTFVEIYEDDEQTQRLVGVIEVLSPSNKAPGETAQALYKQKQRELLASAVHLIEIDLLRAGKHTTAAPPDELRAQAGIYDYHVCCHRFDHMNEYQVYPFRLEDRLPTIAVPLLEGREVALDLQDVFQRTYDGGGYAGWLRYEVAKLKGLSKKQLQWARRLLKEKPA